MTTDKGFNEKHRGSDFDDFLREEGILEHCEEVVKTRNRERKDLEIIIPHEVVGKQVLQQISLMRAWREHLGMTQKEVAEKAGISKATFVKIEQKKGSPRQSTLEKISAAMGINIEQMTLD